jgi:tetratricopeptide (TPR) repeat protein
MLSTGLILAAAALGMEPDEQYDWLVSKGLYLYREHQDSEAQTLLTDALKVRPADPTAGYYLGRLLLRTGRADEAEARFREVLRVHPDDAKARMGLGMALYHQGNYADAQANLSAAEPALGGDALLHYYQGLAASDLRQYKQAGERFQKAGSLDPDLGQDPRYRRGTSYYGQGRYEDAVSEFRAAATGAAVVPAQTGGEEPPRLRRWDLNAALSFQYDSNVILLPSGVDTPGLGISRQDDFVTVFTGRGEYRFIQNDTWTAGAGYGFYQNLHARLSDFNVQDHTPTIYAQRRLGPGSLRFQYLLDYVTVGGSSYLLSNALQSVLTYPQSERTFTQGYFRYQNKDFKSFDLDPFGANDTRDANNYLVGAMQYLSFSDRRGHVRLGYTFDTDRTGGGDVDRAVPGRPSSSDWSYLGHRFSTGVGFQPLPATSVDLAFDYYRQSYDNPNSFSFDGTTVRKDNVFLLTGTAVHDLRSWLWVAFQYSYTRDDANIPAFSYVRHIVSFTVGGRF